jgi:transcriptional regulator with XRE-family HTH domain
VGFIPRADRDPHQPTLRNQWLGHQLRQIRKKSGRSLADAAAYLSYDPSYLARCERAEWPFRHDRLKMLLDFYQVGDLLERERLLAERERCWQTDIFDVDSASSIHNERSVNLPWLEGRAETIYLFAVLAVPGLLQTRSYAEAIMRFNGDPDEVIDHYVDLRLRRQQILDRADLVRLSAVISETALRHPVGDPAVMRDQLGHLLAAGRRPGVEVRVLPANTARPQVAAGPFAVIRLPKPFSSVAYVEHAAGRLYLESPTSRKFIEIYDRIRQSALSAAESAERITRIAEKEWA